VHDSLRATAYQTKQSYGEVITGWMKNSAKLKKYTTSGTLEFFKKISSMGNVIDPVQAVREDRDHNS
jgi:hypothetical protein